MAVHAFGQRVYYEDTDFSGVVYHANYLRFMERGRTELLRDLGVRQSDLFAAREGAPLHFAVARLEIAFRKPARMDDLLVVETVCTAIGGASLTMRQRLTRDGEPLVEAEVRIAVLSGGRPARLPPELAAKLRAGVEAA